MKRKLGFHSVKGRIERGELSKKDINSFSIDTLKRVVVAGQSGIMCIPNNNSNKLFQRYRRNINKATRELEERTNIKK